MRSSQLRMIFKIGMTVIVSVAILIYFLGQRDIEKVKEIQEFDMNNLAKDGLLKKPEIPNEGNDLNGHMVIPDFEANKHVPSFDEIHLTVNPVYKDIKFNKNSIHLSVVACGDRFTEITILLKSAIIFTATHLVFHIFAERELHQLFKSHLEFWPERYRSQIDYFIYDIVYPPSKDENKWKNLFKPCASQRLFIPELLTNVDSLIYVDTDVIFLSPIDKLQEYFTLFNENQLVALVPESEDAATGWYNRFARHPFYGPLGVNSGVMLMNLTRLRRSQWMPLILKFYEEYNLKLTWGDQDLINIYFHYFPQQLYILTCDWNFRPDHCMYMSVCRTAETDGVKILHGSRRVFFNEKQPAFRAVYTSLQKHHFSSSVEYSLLTSLKKLLKQTEITNCGKLSHIFTKQIEQYSVNARGVA